MSAQLLGVAEIAAMLGLTRQRVNQIVQTEGFPPPEAELSAGRIWSRSTVEAWVAAHPSRVTDLFAALLPSFTGEARTVIVRAQEEARGRRHGYLGTEHLLLAVVADAPVAERMAALGIDADTIAADVQAAVPSGDAALVGHIPFTPRAKNIIAGAGALADGDPVEPRHLLRAIVRCGDGIAAALLRERTGLDQQELEAEIDQRMSVQEKPMTPPEGDAAACSLCGQILGQSPSHPDKAELKARMDLLAEQFDQLRRDLG